MPLDVRRRDAGEDLSHRMRRHRRAREVVHQVERAVEMMARMVPGLADRLLSTLLRTSRASVSTTALTSTCSLSRRQPALRCRTRNRLRRPATKECAASRTLAATRSAPSLACCACRAWCHSRWNLQSLRAWRTPVQEPLGRARKETRLQSAFRRASRFASLSPVPQSASAEARTAWTAAASDVSSTAGAYDGPAPAVIRGEATSLRG